MKTVHKNKAKTKSGLAWKPFVLVHFLLEQENNWLQSQQEARWEE